MSNPTSFLALLDKQGMETLVRRSEARAARRANSGKSVATEPKGATLSLDQQRANNTKIH